MLVKKNLYLSYAFKTAHIKIFVTPLDIV